MLSDAVIIPWSCSILDWKGSFMGEMQNASRLKKIFPSVAAKGTCEAFS